MKAETLKKYIVPEVVLLAIFVIGLMISYAIVQSRSYIKLSPLGEAPASGFSFSMPQGEGWQTSPTLKFAENSYYMIAVQNGDGGKVATRLTVMYLLAAGTIDVNDWLKSKAAQMGERISSDRDIQGQNICTHAAMIEIRGKHQRIFFGIAPLPGGRNVMIEAVDTADDDQWGWDVITSVAERFVFKGNPLLQEGEKIITSIRNKGLVQAMGPSRQQQYFLISKEDHIEGFKVEMYARTENNATMNVHAIDSYYVRSGSGRENILQTNDRFDKFLWLGNTLSSGGARARVVEIRLDGATMTVRPSGERYVQEYIPGPAAIPESFSQAVFREMFASGIQQAIVDFIDSQGQILSSIVQTQNTPADANGRIAHVVKLKYFADTNNSAEMYLNADGQTDKFFLLGQSPYMLTRGDKDIILAEFPLWFEYITDIEKLLEKDVPDTNKNPRRIVHNVGTAL